MTVLQPANAAVDTLIEALGPYLGVDKSTFTLEVGSKIVPVFEKILSRLQTESSHNLKNYQWGMIALIGCNIIVDDQGSTNTAPHDSYAIKRTVNWFRQEREIALQELAKGHFHPDILGLEDYLPPQERWKQGSMLTCILGVLARQLLCMGNFPD